MTSTTDFTTLTGTYTLDSVHSRLGFVARHAMVTKVRGSFDDFTGEIHVDGDDPTKSSVSVTAQVASIDTRNEQRDGHLRTNEFLDAEKFPEITFASTAVEAKGGSDFAVTGDLTIKGTTKSVTIPLEFQGQATDPFGNVRIGFEGITEIVRSDYGVSFNATLETGGVLVSDKITLELEISAVKNA
ncbi:YceI family protein [Jatrophihabitans endophyticus]|uniref:YceI family protein n=1 Tax=Jatrophihabitans endophyticus TaxID=1206085 RepID=UPI001A0C9F46|nr:YceI family protein [Jatrophihabitans endophyticus]MBE7188067.1 YceI family protein [Jatrophihabitans endophyticus]